MKFQAPVTKNETYTGIVTDLTYQGMGVIKIDKYPIFVDNTLPGEEIHFRVIKVSKTYAFGKPINWIKTSPDRVEVKDKQYTQTGIAPLQHLAYSAQLTFKQHQIEELLKKEHLDIPVLATIGMETPYHYRNKAQVPVRDINGVVETGFYKRGSHNVVPIEDYYIQDPKLDEAIIVLRDMIRKYHIKPYNEATKKGVVRTVMVRRGYYSHEMMVVFVTNGKKLPIKEQLVEDIRAALPEVKSIFQNINAEDTNVLLGRENRKLWGTDTIEDQLLGLNFAISPSSFYQVNPQQTEKLYASAIEQAGLTGKETVIDAYSGIGTISLAMASHAKKVYGVEVVSSAVQDAKLNAKKNGIKNAEFVVEMAEIQMKKWAEDGLDPDVLVVDPPRKGLAPEFIEATGEMKPKKIVYVSCNPATLVRDITLLKDQGYSVNQPIQPVDQFPQTTHIESITVLER
ncbi:RNA methyltransferase [Paucilactobacillus oligofermentans DSM 15707 = LMG 22743]|uniref:RNA methyltransferase n=1 Tax=Paucilactobacillus oligofermentans DSM 15707 = LMG 22743 TaxID=1423778 RepID=A0A0R1RFL2_9LACO|nr:23S rRNA (uracil(1939)-C(5))-methyltransferase RlmD [Paucilactobacillus oligofermentans]KRL55166.1 RNA methyltransferase [Paucilactobacillus oligofermentans DSM 15707 = LMG 22743]CUS25845.1 Putative 23S rRNA (Uracil-5-)-methyltransferase [Paucilactobacillus oligofermentans DSM 15707 = LMG 22743]